MGLLYDTLFAVHDIHASRQPCGVGIIADALSVQVENTLYSLSSYILIVNVNHGIDASGSAIGHAIQIQAHRLCQCSASRFKPACEAT